MSTMVLSGTQSCDPQTVPQAFTANGWNGVRSYACGVVTFQLSFDWPNPIGATDVSFTATLQGQVTSSLAVNGTAIAADASSTDSSGASCAFYNGGAASVAPAINQCWNTPLAAAPHVARGKLSGPLSLVLTTGPACAPDCSHGTGMNVQKLFVR
jgi:hypothetical protein